MNVGELQELLQLEPAAGLAGLKREVTGGYCGDLLSDVMANAAEGAAWMTIQGHQNVVAVAVLRQLAVIILVNGRRPDDDAVTRADQEGIPILLSPSTAYELAGRLYKAGIGTSRT